MSRASLILSHRANKFSCGNGEEVVTVAVLLLLRIPQEGLGTLTGGIASGARVQYGD